MTTVSTLPTLPERGNPATFNALFEGFLAALKNNFVGEVNTVASEINAAALTAVNAVAQALFSTSTTSLTIQTGAASLTIEPGKLFAAGQYVMVISSASPATWMYGTVASYNDASGALGVTVTDVSGSGVLAAWRVSVAGVKGAPGGVTLTGAEALTNKTIGAGSVWNGTAVGAPYGGTGATSLTGLVKGNGTGAMTAAVAGTDYLAPGSPISVPGGGTGATSLTGLVKGNGASAMTAAAAGADYLAPSGALGTPSSGNLGNCTADGTSPVGYLNIPQNSKSTAYTLVLADAGKHILHPSADTTARTFTVPANSSVAYPIGTAITVVNQNGAGVITIAITTDTMRMTGTGATGSRTLSANGVATLLKITATEWIASGSGLS